MQGLYALRCRHMKNFRFLRRNGEQKILGRVVAGKLAAENDGKKEETTPSTKYSWTNQIVAECNILDDLD